MSSYRSFTWKFGLFEKREAYLAPLVTSALRKRERTVCVKERNYCDRGVRVREKGGFERERERGKDD